jgi:hypothetical protein
MALSVDYVGSVARHLFVQLFANTALYPAAGSIAARQPSPQYGGGLYFDENVGNSSYNALQAKFEKRLSLGLDPCLVYVVQVA